MKFAFILHREYTKIGGLELLVKGLAFETSRKLSNDQIYIISYGDKDNKEVLNRNLEYITVKSNYIFNGMYPLPSIFSIIKLYKTLNDVNPDKFITFGRHFISTWIAQIWGIKNNKTRFHNEQANDKHTFRWKIFSIFQSIQDKTIVDYILKKATTILPGSNSVRKFLNKNWKLKNINEQNLTSFIDTNKLDRYRKVSENNKVKMVLFAGRIVELKGYKYFLELCNKYKDNNKYKFIIIGEGEGEKDVNSFITNKLGNLEYLGKLSHIETLGYISICDLFVLPSKVEGLPTSLLEARYYNRNILCSDIGPNREALKGYSNVKYISKSTNIEEFINSKSISDNQVMNLFTLEVISKKFAKIIKAYNI